MNESVAQIKAHRRKIAKLEKDFNYGKARFPSGFTIDIYYGGNREVDVERINIGSFCDPDGTAKTLYEMALKSLKNGLDFWIDAAKKDLAELHGVLYDPPVK